MSIQLRDRSKIRPVYDPVILGFVNASERRYDEVDEDGRPMYSTATRRQQIVETRRGLVQSMQNAPHLFDDSLWNRALTSLAFDMEGQTPGGTGILTVAQQNQLQNLAIKGLSHALVAGAPVNLETASRLTEILVPLSASHSGARGVLNDFAEYVESGIYRVSETAKSLAVSHTTGDVQRAFQKAKTQDSGGGDSRAKRGRYVVPDSDSDSDAGPAADAEEDSDFEDGEEEDESESYAESESLVDEDDESEGPAESEPDSDIVDFDADNGSDDEDDEDEDEECDSDSDE
jgi:hypothetical protein